MDQILLSVAIVTRNRPDSLERTLRSLFGQTPQPYEVIVSDDSSSDDMIQVTEKIVRAYGYKYVKGPGKGLYVNRNFVAKHCTGTHIRTMDDDHEFPEYHMQICIDAIRTNPEVIWTIGEYNPWDKDKTVPLVDRLPGQLDARGFAYLPKDMDNYFGISCGASIYPSSVIQKGIMNIESYKFGILYLEYGARLYKKGYKIKPLSTTYVLHHGEKNDTVIASSKVVLSARLLCMLLFSFKYFPSFKNKFLTVNQIARELLQRKYSIKLVEEAYHNYEKEAHRNN